MPKLTNFRWQILWSLLLSTTVAGSLLPCFGIHSNIFSLYLNENWVHFLAYAALSYIPMLTWKRKTALAIGTGEGFIGAALEVVRAIAGAHPLNIQYIVINLLGIGAGILLGLNILTRQSRISQADV